MSYLIDHWSPDPFLAVVAVLVAWHELGLARLARKSRPERTRQRRQRSLWFYAGLGVLLLTVCSSLDYWSSRYFFVHMIGHLLIMFAAPSLVVAGAPWQPLLAGLPAHLGRRFIRSAARGRVLAPVRVAAGRLLGPWGAVAFFNAVMIAWHVPALLDLAERNELVHIWLMHGSFFGAGVAFWAQFLPSPPLHRRLPLGSRLIALVASNLGMWVLAIAMSVFTQASWYPVYDHVPGVTLSPFADQQIGAAILWVCGDFWAAPMISILIRQLLARSELKAREAVQAGAGVS